MGGARVTAVIVTFNRPDVLSSTLAAVLAQVRPPDEIIVVDNGDPQGTANLIGEFPAVQHLPTGDNLGFGAGLALGMRASDDQADYFWLLDDDTVPGPNALQRCLELASMVDRLGVVGLSGGSLVWGIPVRTRGRLERLAFGGAGKVFRCDFTLVDGALVSRRAVDHVGYPREDFFMMMEDVEYTGRIRQAGFEVVLLDEPLVERGHLGSGGQGGPAPPWRGYYQSRNHLATAVGRRSVVEVLGWVYRQARLIAGTLRSSDRKLERIHLRLLGARDGLRGRMGRTIEPTR